MLKKMVFVPAILVFAFVILFVSILQSSSVSYSFMSPPLPYENQAVGKTEVNYVFPFAGSVLPDSPLWKLKAARDRAWYAITSSPLRKAELALLFSDKRLVSAKILVEKGKFDIAISTITKGEKYLETATNQEIIARERGYDTNLFLNKLALSSLKHREVIEELMPLLPEEGKPLVVKTEDYSKNAYKAVECALNSKGMPVPINPFDGD